jgi:diadenosine tetraphosphate (Ap4A) HIT family hydrolase
MWPWNDPQSWSRLRAGENCPLCQPSPPTETVVELPTAYVRVPRLACLAGYVCVVYRRHVVEWHDLSPAEAADFARDVCRVSRVVEELTAAAKVNWLSLGNLVPHLHVHLCPRRPGDRFEGRALDPGDVQADLVSREEHALYIAELRVALETA